MWPRLQAVCSLDLTYRMERFSDGGLARVLADLHPELAMDGDRLRIDKPHHCHQVFDLAGAGIVVMPSAFAWPSLLVDCCDVDQPALVYPPRGVAQLWEETSAEHTDPLHALVGRTRAMLLATLGLPRTTTQLAGQLGLSPPAVSQHLKILRDTALVSARRRGRMVLYQRTPAATALLEPSGPASKLADRPKINPRPALPTPIGLMPRLDHETVPSIRISFLPVQSSMVRSEANRCFLLRRSATILFNACSPGANAGRFPGEPDGSHRGPDLHDPPGQARGVRQALRRGSAAAQRQFGIDMLGQFISLDDDQTFVWLRRFGSQEERQRKWEEFYGSTCGGTTSVPAPTR